MHLAAVSFCGGLSTFSSFIQQITDLGEMARWPAAFGAPAIEIAIGIAAALLGETIVRRRRPAREAVE